MSESNPNLQSGQFSGEGKDKPRKVTLTTLRKHAVGSVASVLTHEGKVHTGEVMGHYPEKGQKPGPGEEPAISLRDPEFERKGWYPEREILQSQIHTIVPGQAYRLMHGDKLLSIHSSPQEAEIALRTFARGKSFLHDAMPRIETPEGGHYRPKDGGRWSY